MSKKQQRNRFCAKCIKLANCGSHTDLKPLPEGQLMDGVGHVGALGLRCGTVRGHVEVSRHLAGREVQLESRGEKTHRWHLQGIYFIN